MHRLSICRRRRERSNEDGAASVAAFGYDDDAVDVVDDSGGDGEIGGGMVSEGEVGCYCSFFYYFLLAFRVGF